MRPRHHGHSTLTIQAGYDLVGDEYDGTNAPQPDDDPLDQCYGREFY